MQLYSSLGLLLALLSTVVQAGPMIGKPVNHRNQETGCPEQWTLHLTGCYQRVESQMTWEQATSHCKVGDADLLNLHNEVDYRQIINLFGNTEQRFWIALEKTGRQDERAHSKEKCVSSDAKGNRHKSHCHELHGVICRKHTVRSHLVSTPGTTPPPTTRYTPPDHVEGTCPGEAWLSYGPYCYFFCDRNDPTCEAHQYWHDANERCQELVAGSGYNATLPSIHDEAENYFVYENMRKAGSVSGWIGLYREEIGGEFQWVNGDDKVFEAWRGGAPSNDEYMCSAMSVGDPVWDDSNCTTLSYEPNTLMCKTWKQTNATTTSVPTSTPAFPGFCPNAEWERYGDHCYLYAPDEYLDWDQAMEVCVEEAGRDARLATVFSQEHNSHTWSRLIDNSDTPTRRGAWIGMVKQTIGGGDWYWFDGEDITYENWAPEEPGEGPLINCADMFTGTGLWTTATCDEKRGFVCQVDVTV